MRSALLREQLMGFALTVTAVCASENVSPPKTQQKDREAADGLLGYSAVSSHLHIIMAFQES